jgi:hypothetical protein
VHFRTGRPNGSAADAPLEQLLGDVQELLDARVPGARAAPITGKNMMAPDVMFGCIMDAAQMECDPSRQTGLLGGNTTQHWLAVGRPSSSWIAELRQRLDSAGARYALAMTIEVGQYLPRQRGLKGTKYVELGRGHEMNLPWLTSLETPVSVLQLTAAIVDRDGLAVRIAAEGLVAKRTSILLSALDVQAALQDKDIEALRTAVRTDLEGKPRVLEVAVNNLLEDLGLMQSGNSARALRGSSE